MKLILSKDHFEAEEFYFTFDSVRYSAEIDRPKDKQATATIVIIPGHGRTDFVGGSQYLELRQFFTRLGLTVISWDKRGCGRTEGNYEHHQSVESSALEAVAAIEEFKQKKVPGSSHIGLWGISRGGWICPLIINKFPSIAFWISVSGTDQFDNFRYMVETNLRIEGRDDKYIQTVMKEFDHYVHVLRFGGETYEQFTLSTNTLFTDPFYISLGESRVSEAEFTSAKDYYSNSGDVFNEKTGLRVLVPDFDSTLSKIECPVLAIFGNLDSQVDSRKTEVLYQRTIGINPKAKLETKTLPNCNHNMQECRTGGILENLEKYEGQSCEGYYQSMKGWLKKYGFVK